MKKKLAFCLALILSFSAPQSINAQTDDFIISDTPRAIYQGTLEADEITANARFTDVPEDHWARTAIVRDAALNLAKGYARSFSPQNTMTNEEAIAFIMRSIGRENEAVNLAATLQASAPADSNLRTMWSIGYLNIASQIGIITPAEYENALRQTDITGSAASTFYRLGFATRENVADWLVKAMRTVIPASFPQDTTVQKILSYSDYNSISAHAAPSVELLAIHNIMNGYPDGSFRPKGNLTRAEMAQLLYSLDDMYFAIMGYEKRTGIVGELRDNQMDENGRVTYWRNIYLRSSDGTIDVLQYQRSQSSSPISLDLDAVTYKNNQVSGMSALAERDVVEYIVRAYDNTVMYVKKISDIIESTVSGQLYSVDADLLTINILDSNKKHFIYYAASGLFRVDSSGSYLRVDGKYLDISRLPYGSGFNLRLQNNTVVEVNYAGEQTLVSELRGIVIENNSEFGYITIIDNNGNEVTKYYYENDMTVEKQQHYDDFDEIGYIDSVFPDFRYDPRDTTISEIEPGDIVFLTLSKDDSSIISSISAATNYIAKYGKLISINRSNDNSTSEILIEYENKQTAWFTLANEIFVSREAKHIGTSGLMVGDWVKLLVNQAIISPGYVIESCKEIAVEGNGHLITKIVKGGFAGINEIQKLIMIEHSYTLTKTGWSDYKTISTYPLATGDVEFYNNETRISADYAQKYLKYSDMDVYLAFENSYTGEKLRKITFRNSRDELLPADTVDSSAGNGQFTIIGGYGEIKADNGTIVRRYGRLVGANDILASDYVTVSLNGNGVAAVVDIYDAPDTSKINIARGRIYSIDDGKSFKVSSMSVLSGTSWIYTPIQREFTIDHRTLFLNAEGFVNRDSFIGYTDASKIDAVYYIVYDGARATHVIEAPYATRNLRGTVYQLTNNGAMLKDASWYDDVTGKWIPVSNTNAVVAVTIMPNTLIAKQNAVVTKSGLTVGDQLRVMSAVMPAIVRTNDVIEGNIVIVEK